MSVSLKKIPGVESVNVRLKTGLVSITLQPGNTVTLARVRKAIEDDAFTPKQARVHAVGQVVSSSGKLEFKITGTNEAFPLAPAPGLSWKGRLGEELVVTGVISAPAKRGVLGELQITSAAAKTPEKN